LKGGIKRGLREGFMGKLRGKKLGRGSKERIKIDRGEGGSEEVEKGTAKASAFKGG